MTPSKKQMAVATNPRGSSMEVSVLVRALLPWGDKQGFSSGVSTVFPSTKKKKIQQKNPHPVTNINFFFSHWVEPTKSEIQTKTWKLLLLEVVTHPLCGKSCQEPAQAPLDSSSAAQFTCMSTQANSLAAPWGRAVLCSTSRKWLQKPLQNAQVTADPVGTGQALLSAACQLGERAWWWKHMPKDVLKVGWDKTGISALLSYYP